MQIFYSCYYWMAKYLTEAVHGYGDKNVTETLYCGMDRVLIMSSMSIVLNSATSTTSELTVAQNFATSDGVILEINNQGSKTHNIAPRFNVSWLSRFRWESERIFIQCDGRMELVSMRMCLENKWIKYESFLKVIYHIDAVCTGTVNYVSYLSMEKKKLYNQILNTLLNIRQ